MQDLLLLRRKQPLHVMRAGQPRPVSKWAAAKPRVFFELWIAAIESNIGKWMQKVRNRLDVINSHIESTRDDGFRSSNRSAPADRAAAGTARRVRWRNRGRSRC